MDSREILWYQESLWQSQQREDTKTGKHGNTEKNDGIHKKRD